MIVIAIAITTMMMMMMIVVFPLFTIGIPIRCHDFSLVFRSGEDGAAKR